MTDMTEWWSHHAAGLIGGFGGGGLGALCGILGAFAGWQAPKGRCKPLVVGGFGVFVLIGVASAIAGVIGVVQGQPYHVWYPLVLCGFLFTLLPSILLPVVLMRYRQAEARRMQAEELRRA